MAKVALAIVQSYPKGSRSEMTNTKKRPARPMAKNIPAVGQRIIQGLEKALAWSKGEDVPVRVTPVQLL